MIYAGCEAATHPVLDIRVAQAPLELGKVCAPPPGHLIQQVVVRDVCADGRVHAWHSSISLCKIIYSMS